MDSSSGQGGGSSSANHAWKKAVSRFGQRWKVQYENCGVLYYLGTFDTQEEAIRAYEFKARSMENPLISAGVPMETLSYPAPLPSSSSSVPVPPSAFANPPPASTTAGDAEARNRIEARALWDRLSMIYQRLLLAKAVQSKLSDLQLSFPDQHKEVLLKTLNEEMVMLSLVKTQLEEAMVYYFSSEVALNELPDMTALEHWDLTSMLNQSQSSMFPISHILTPLDPPVPPESAVESADVSATPSNIDITTGKVSTPRGSHPKSSKSRQSTKSTKPSPTLPSFDAAISNEHGPDYAIPVVQLQPLTANVETTPTNSQQVEIAQGDNVAIVPSLTTIPEETSLSNADISAAQQMSNEVSQLPTIHSENVQQSTSEVLPSASEQPASTLVQETAVVEEDTKMDI